MQIPYYYTSIDFDALVREYPPAKEFSESGPTRGGKGHGATPGTPSGSRPIGVRGRARAIPRWTRRGSRSRPREEERHASPDALDPGVD